MSLQAADIYMLVREVDRTIMHIEFVDGNHYNAWMPRDRDLEGILPASKERAVQFPMETERLPTAFRTFLFKGLTTDNGCDVLRLLCMRCTSRLVFHWLTRFGSMFRRLWSTKFSSAAYMVYLKDALIVSYLHAVTSTGARGVVRHAKHMMVRCCDCVLRLRSQFRALSSSSS